MNLKHLMKKQHHIEDLTNDDQHILYNLINDKQQAFYERSRYINLFQCNFHNIILYKGKILTYNLQYYQMNNIFNLYDATEYWLNIKNLWFIIRLDFNAYFSILQINHIDKISSDNYIAAHLLFSFNNYEKYMDYFYSPIDYMVYDHIHTALLTNKITEQQHDWLQLLWKKFFIYLVDLLRIKKLVTFNKLQIK